MAIRFLIDSASDLLPAEAAALGVTCIPMQITFGAETYEDGVTLSHKDFYEKLGACKELPVTSQINPAVYDSYFEELTKNGDEVITITLSSGLSGTTQSARIAAADYEGKVFVVDSLNATIGQRILLLRGLTLAKEGLSAAQIAETLDAEKLKIRLVAIIDTLEYLKKGGRISAATAIAGAALGIKPAIAVVDGKIANVGKARGRQTITLLKQLIEEAGEIDWEKPNALVYSENDAALQQFIEATPELWEGHPLPPAHSLGCTIGTHIGPGAYGYAFFEK